MQQLSTPFTILKIFHTSLWTETIFYIHDCDSTSEMEFSVPFSRNGKWENLSKNCWTFADDLS